MLYFMGFVIILLMAFVSDLNERKVVTVDRYNIIVRDITF